MNKRGCLHCGKELRGRTDQKFCDAQCRNSYHNQTKREDEQYIHNVNSLIRRNRRILKDLCPEGKATLRREILENRGYDYRYFSGIYVTTKATYYICYDYALAAVIDNGKEKALIIQKQNYFDKYQINPWQNLNPIN